jgi:hypothetical protein
MGMAALADTVMSDRCLLACCLLDRLHLVRATGLPDRQAARLVREWSACLTPVIARVI